MGSLKLAGYRPGNGIIKRIQDIFSPNKGIDSLKPSTSELGVGEIAYMKGKKYLVVEAERRANCHGCDLLKGGICQKETRHPCSAYSRSDQTWAIFKEVKDGSSK